MLLEPHSSFRFQYRLSTIDNDNLFWNSCISHSLDTQHRKNNRCCVLCSFLQTGIRRLPPIWPTWRIIWSRHCGQEIPSSGEEPVIRQVGGGGEKERRRIDWLFGGMIEDLFDWLIDWLIDWYLYWGTVKLSCFTLRPSQWNVSFPIALHSKGWVGRSDKKKSKLNFKVIQLL